MTNPSENDIYNYSGRLADRQTEEDYTTENLMTVSFYHHLVVSYSTIKNLLIKFMFMLRVALGVMDAFLTHAKTTGVKFLMVAPEARVVMFTLGLVQDFRICMN